MSLIDKIKYAWQCIKRNPYRTAEFLAIVIGVGLYIPATILATPATLAMLTTVGIYLATGFIVSAALLGATVLLMAMSDIFSKILPEKAETALIWVLAAGIVVGAYFLCAPVSAAIALANPVYLLTLVGIAAAGVSLMIGKVAMYCARSFFGFEDDNVEDEDSDNDNEDDPVLASEAEHAIDLSHASTNRVDILLKSNRDQFPEPEFEPSSELDLKAKSDDEITPHASPASKPNTLTHTPLLKRHSFHAANNSSTKEDQKEVSLVQATTPRLGHNN